MNIKFKDKEEGKEEKELIQQAIIKAEFFNFKPNPQNFCIKDMSDFVIRKMDLINLYDEILYRPDYSKLTYSYKRFSIKKEFKFSLKEWIDGLAYNLNISSMSDATVKAFRGIDYKSVNLCADGNDGYASMTILIIEQNNIIRYFIDDEREVNKEDFFKFINLHPNLSDIRKILSYSSLEENIIKSDANNFSEKKIKI